jgi:uncharacterized protein YndB with AHSA1/START domain
MPTFDDTTTTNAAPEEVWKALYDPARFPEWWTGIATVEPGDAGGYTMYPDGYPDFPMAQQLSTSRAHGRVTVSCLVSDLVFAWHLEPLQDGGTQISVHVEIPEAETPRLATQREAVASSLRRLAAVATGAPPTRG